MIITKFSNLGSFVEHTLKAVDSVGGASNPSLFGVGPDARYKKHQTIPANQNKTKMTANLCIEGIGRMVYVLGRSGGVEPREVAW
mmetsp:Transcript_41241/g.80715  ORF Transcript_41241/g.80715 Transcript_41241/m.80715 type:complete len:85 (+) Transcript_41241:277-531(+)